MTETAIALQAARAMTEARVGAVIVTGTEGKLAEIFSERDLMARVVVPSKDPGQARLSEVMTRDVFSVVPDQKIDDVRVELQARHIRHLPIVLEGKVVGILSLRDILRADLEARTHEVEALENCLLGKTEPRE